MWEKDTQVMACMCRLEGNFSAFLPPPGTLQSNSSYQSASILLDRAIPQIQSHSSEDCKWNGKVEMCPPPWDFKDSFQDRIRSSWSKGFNT